MADERKSYNTTLRVDLVKQLRILAAQVDKRQNDLLEEAIQDLLKKYEKKVKKQLPYWKAIRFPSDRHSEALLQRKWVATERHTWESFCTFEANKNSICDREGGEND